MLLDALSYVLALIIGFIIGFLVFRNNREKFIKIEDDLENKVKAQVKETKEYLNELKAKLDDIKNLSDNQVKELKDKLIKRINHFIL